MIKQPKTIFFLDFDGTLSKIAKHPSLAVLSPSRKDILRRLAVRKNTKVAIISGRKLSDIKKRVGIPNIAYIGNHGFEIFAYGKHWIHPGAKKSIFQFKQIIKVLKNKIAHPGILIEDKGLTISVHFRLLAKNRLTLFKDAFFSAMEPFGKSVKITRGKKVFEIRPPLDWNKGKAVEWVLGKFKLMDYMPIYIGDDKTDEDAFLALKNKGATIHVGKGKTYAKTRFKNIEGVYSYLCCFMKQ